MVSSGKGGGWAITFHHASIDQKITGVNLPPSAGRLASFHDREDAIGGYGKVQRYSKSAVMVVVGEVVYGGS